MTWNVVRDDTAKRIIATAEGEFHAAETLQMLSALRDSGGLTYGLLFDVRRMRGAPTVAGLKPFTEITNPAAAGDDTRGPLAIVATGSVHPGSPVRLRCSPNYPTSKSIATVPRLSSGSRLKGDERIA